MAILQEEGSRNEHEPRSLTTALFAPGQGLRPTDISAYYTNLLSHNRDLVEQRLQHAQEAICEAHGYGDYNIMDVVANGDSPEYKKTSIVQPLVYTASVLAHEIARQKGVTYEKNSTGVAGHSLGEYSALTFAGVFPFETGIWIVANRGKCMQDAADAVTTKLLSVTRLHYDEVRELCQKTQTQVSLVNSPELIVVGGTEHDLANFTEELNQSFAGRRVRTTMLETAAAFHTRYMEGAAGRLDELMRPIHFNNPQVVAISNLTGEVSPSGTAWKNHLIESMYNPVRWDKVVDSFARAGVVDFREVGPGNSLASLNRANGIDPEKTQNILALAA